MQKSKILIVEDTESIRQELSDILGFEGFEVITAENGQEGIDRATEHSPDLILCDIMMPVKDGYQVFDEIQHNYNLKSIPFIFLTAKATQDNVRQGMILGADDYITKPFDIQQVINSINSRLEKAAERKKSELKKRETLQYNISRAFPHELRTPLNGIIGLSSIMKETDSGLTMAQITEFSQGIYESGERLFGTIEKFLYHTEIELLLHDEEKKNKLLNEVTENGSLILANQSEIVAKKHNRSSDLEIASVFFSVKVDLTHFEIIIENIVDNAFKFSKKGDKVKIDIAKDESTICISVSDKGAGFGNINRISVEAFSQFNRDQMEQQGVGLGLITAIKLIEFYSGEISWSSNSDNGTTVKITLLSAD